MTVASDVRLSEDAKKARTDAEAKRRAELALLRKDLNETFGPAHGLRALRYIMDLCGYQNYIVIADPATGDPLPNGTLYNAARQGIYIKLRRFLSPEILIPVENKGLEQDETDLFS